MPLRQSERPHPVADDGRLLTSARDRVAARRRSLYTRRRRFLPPLIAASSVALLILVFAVMLLNGRNRLTDDYTGPIFAPRALMIAMPSPAGAIQVQAASLPTALPLPTSVAPTAEAAPLDELPPGPALLPGPITPPAGWSVHYVEAGDTIPALAARYGSAADALAALNRLRIGETLFPGRALMVPVYQGAVVTRGADVRVGRQDRAEVALTFDIEIDAASIYQILDILRQRDAYATFFVTGRWVQRFPDAARAIVAAGHELGNHSLTHPAFTRIGYDGIGNELNSTEQIVVEITGVTTKPFFRFPYGAKNPALVDEVAKYGYISYHWTADEHAIPGWIDAVAAGQASPNGAILLMHQRAGTVAGLPGWLDRLAGLGVRGVPLSRVLR